MPIKPYYRSLIPPTFYHYYKFIVRKHSAETDSLFPYTVVLGDQNLNFRNYYRFSLMRKKK